MPASAHRCLRRVLCPAVMVLLTLGTASAGLAIDVAAAPAATVSPFAPSWCLAAGANFEGWAGTSPEIPICGPGPYYGGPGGWVSIPGPYGADSSYYNATDGFQCVELAERFLAVVAGLAPVKANGSTVAVNYHAAYPDTTLIVNGSAAAVGHPPAEGDVISFASGPSFAGSGDGHVALVVGSHVNGSGDGTVEIAQENVAPTDYLRTLDLVDWRLIDPEDPADAEYQFPDAEWLLVPSSHPAVVLDPAASQSAPALTTAAVSADPTVGLVELPELRRLTSAHAGARGRSGHRERARTSRRGAG